MFRIFDFQRLQVHALGKLSELRSERAERKQAVAAAQKWRPFITLAICILTEIPI